MPNNLRNPLFIASLGNPGSTYAHTLHSAGHTLLGAIVQYLKYLPFNRCDALAKSLVSRPYRSSVEDPTPAADWTCWQSPSLMNVSGRPVSQAWKSWQDGALSPTRLSTSEAAHIRKERGRLIILHDELDLPLGQLKKRNAGVSARGHNGVKSVQSALPKTPFMRIAVGIGRPEGGLKEPGVISKWVLRRMTREEKEKIEGKAGECVDMLKALANS